MTLGATRVQRNVGATYTFAGVTVLMANINNTVTNVTVAYGAGTPMEMNPSGNNTWETFVPPFAIGSRTPVLVLTYDAAGRTASCGFTV